MNRSLLALLFASLAVAAPPADPPAEFAKPESPPKPKPFDVKYVDAGTQDAKLKGLMAPEGFKVELVADAPTVINPVGMTFAPDGTLFVAEWVPDPGREWYEFKETFRYRDGSTKQVATMKKFAPDVVKVLTRNPKSGVYDKADVIFTDELPSSLLWYDGWLYTASRGSVRRYKQSQPGGKWDVRETIAQGFCGFHHHQVSGVTVGPDGWLYITSGDDDNFTEGSDGSRATVLRTGAVFRCKPDGSKLETYSLGYRNPYRDLALDRFGNLFHADNDNEDGSRFTGCRLVHVAEDIDYGWRLREGARCCQPDHVRGAVAGERPGKIAPMLKTGRGSPAGVLFYDDTQLPKQYQHLMYYPDVFRRSVRAYTIEPNGSSFAVTHEMDFLTAPNDPLFRPCHAVIGPDGALYICDWRADSGGAGKLWGDGKNGRIYKLTWAGTEKEPAIPLRGLDTWAKHASKTSTTDDLKVGLLSADATTRRLAQIELARRGATQADDVRKLFTAVASYEKAPLPSRLLAVGGLQQMWNADAEKVVLNLLTDKEPDVRRVACEAVGRNSKEFAAGEALAKRLADESPVVRRAAALAVGHFGAGNAADLILTAWKADDGKDPFLTDAYLRALERLGKPGIEAMIALANSGDDIHLRKVADGYTGLRTKAAYDALPALLGNPHLKAEAKAALVQSYLNYQFDPPVSLDPLAKFLSSHPDESAEVKRAGLEVLAASNSIGGGPGGEFVLGLLDASEEEVRLAALTAIEKGKLLTAAAKVRAVVADTKRTAGERTAALKAGRALGGPEYVGAVKDLLGNAKEAAGLKVEALRALAGVDAPAARTFAEQFLDQPEPALVGEAISVLGTTEDGAKLVGERFAAKKLPREHFQRVSDVLRKFPKNPALAALNTEVMRGALLLSLEPDQVEAMRKKVEKDGDPKRGRAVYLNTAVVACATCHKMEGVGGSVGPDLTRVWDTHTVEKVLESIVTPNKEIKEGYQSYTASTLDGQSYTGLKVSDTKDEVVIREATGRDVKIPKKELDKIAASKISLMPDNVVSQLSYDQFIDLIAFLKSKKEQEGLRGLVVEANVLVGLPKDLNATTDVKPDPTVKPDGVEGKWQPLPADPNGILALKPLLPAQATGALVVAYVYSPKKQTVGVQLWADDTVRVTAGAAKVFERTASKPGKFEDAEKFTVELEPGWTPVVVRLSTTGPTHRLGLQFSGEELRTGAKKEEVKQPEGKKEGEKK